MSRASSRLGSCPARRVRTVSYTHLDVYKRQSLSWLPELVVLRVDDPPREARFFTLLRNTGHSNVTSLSLIHI